MLIWHRYWRPNDKESHQKDMKKNILQHVIDSLNCLIDTWEDSRDKKKDETLSQIDKELHAIIKINDIVNQFKGIEQFMEVTKNKSLGKEEFAYKLMQDIVNLIEKEG